MVAQRTVVRFEGGDIERMQARTIAQLKRTIEDAGVVFYGTPVHHHSPVVDIRLADDSGARLHNDRQTDE